MKKKIYIFVFSLIGLSLPILAQVSNDNEDGVYKVQNGMPLYKEGEVIVKFTDSEKVTIRRNVQGKFLSASVNKVQKKLQEIGTFEMEQLMPLTGKKVTNGRRKAPSSGRSVKDVDLSQLYVIRFDNEKLSVPEAVEQLKELDNVEFAEPNGIAYICDDGTPSESFDDPYYSQQWNIPAINLPALWAMPEKDKKRPVIAILDTGCDITHPDLVDNIWTNEAEASGEEFADDDANGYYDDLHGWDFIANTAIIKDGMDKNGHGTHCAGIAAACGNNGIGVVGANPEAYILPIKVMGDDGNGDNATIIKGIDYAIAANANILSMSFGTYATTANSLRAALEKAYAKYIVSVGAAGNSGIDINVDNPSKPSPVGPGCFDIVIGVQASDATGQRAGYSNYDPDGPFFSKYGDIYGDYYNYDVMAPGSNIISTYPGGRYKELSGTSMATPLVAGALSRLLQIKGFDYAKDYGLYGDLSESKDEHGVLDIVQVTTWNDENRKVALRLMSTSFVEVDGDMDGEMDAGETIDIYPSIRSLWGKAENIKISARSDYNPNISANAVTFLTNDVDFGLNLNSQGSATSTNPIRVKINEKVNDGYNLILYYTISCDNETDEETNTEKLVNYTVENGVELDGIIDHDMTLYPNVHYIMNKNCGIPRGVTLTIKGGTVIKYSGSPQFKCEGKLVCESTPDSMILVTKANSNAGEISFSITSGGFRYTKFKNVECCNYGGSYEHCQFEDLVLRDAWTGGYKGISKYCTFYDDIPVSFSDPYALIYDYCNIMGSFILYNNSQFYTTIRGNHCNLMGRSFNAYSTSIQELTTSNYLGTSSNAIIKQMVIDVNDGYGYGYINPDQVPKTPYSEAHGCVWKVLVDEFDVQDGYEAMENAPENYPTSPTNENYKLFPIGVGKHECKVYFNRPMNVAIPPTITMGLRSPYTQTDLGTDGTWSDDSLVYTLPFNITAKSNIDGTNRIRIEDAEDNEHFRIPSDYKRFNVLVQTAGSLSTGLMATPGLGKVQLDWETKDEDFDDLMGYNVYRYNDREETYWDYDENWNYVEKTRIVQDTIKVNEQLIEPGVVEDGKMEQSFVDYNVTPGTTYYYLVKEIGTDLQSYDVSNAVAATPLTAQKGDSNGSMSVDVADVMTDVAYIMNEDPQPFIFEAADINDDSNVNILDIIGTANMIVAPASANTASADATATYTIENGYLYVDCPVALGGVQVQLKGDKQTSEFEAQETLKGMEQLSAWQSDKDWIFLSFSMSNNYIPTGKQAILKIGDADVDKVVLSDMRGRNIIAINGTSDEVDGIEALPYGLDNNNKVVARVYDMSGREVSTANMKHGIYVVSLYVDGHKVKSYKMMNK